MVWKYQYDESIDETTIEWHDSNSDTVKSTTIAGRQTGTRNGILDSSDAREAIAGLIQNAGTPDRIRMQFDMNFQFERLDQS